MTTTTKRRSTARRLPPPLRYGEVFYWADNSLRTAIIKLHTARDMHQPNLRVGEMMHAKQEMRQALAAMDRIMRDEMKRHNLEAPEGFFEDDPAKVNTFRKDIPKSFEVGLEHDFDRQQELTLDREEIQK